MGRKGKSKLSPLALIAKHRPEILRAADDLLEICTINHCANRAKEWEQFEVIHKIISKVQKFQKGNELPEVDREANIPEFLLWMKQNGVDSSAVELFNYNELGWGLKATRAIKEDELLLTIPKKIMFSTETAVNASLKAIMSQDKLLSGMQNVSLALHLLCERLTPNSYWSPYFNILPSSYCNTLYFTPEQLALLKGSPALSEALNQYKSIARQFAYFYKLFYTNDVAKRFPFIEFCYDDYRWAVSTVMTRQNQIPGEKQRNILSLIPLWDMCNHRQAQITTHYSVKEKCSECFALSSLEPGDQIFIFYGPRTNGEFLVHNGFFYEDNELDGVEIKMGISKSDPLFGDKSRLLARLNLLSSRKYFLHAGDAPIDSELLAFLRIFSMDEESLQSQLSSDCQSQRKLRDFGELISKQNELSAWSFLCTRAKLLLSSYCTTIAEDQALLRKKQGLHFRLALQLRLAEKTILDCAVRFAVRQCDLLADLPDNIKSLQETVDMNSQISIDDAIQDIHLSLDLNDKLTPSAPANQDTNTLRDIVDDSVEENSKEDLERCVPEDAEDDIGLPTCIPEIE